MINHEGWPGNSGDSAEQSAKKHEQNGNTSLEDAFENKPKRKKDCFPICQLVTNITLSAQTHKNTRRYTWINTFTTLS